MLFVAAIDLPHMDFTAFVNEPGFGIHFAAAGRAEVVCVDFQPYRLFTIVFYEHVRTDTSQGFCQGGGRPSVKQAHGLYGSVVYGHAAADKTGFCMMYFDAQDFSHGALHHARNEVECIFHRNIVQRYFKALPEQKDQYSILVAEDEEFLRNSICLNLEMEGYRVEAVADGAEALRTAVEDKHDLLILDVMMPVLDGMEVCRKVREAGIETPVFFLTARQSGQDRIQGLRLGADDYLTKPFELEELLLRVERLLKRATGAAKKQEEIAINGRVFYPGKMEVALEDKQSVSLNRKEAEILNLLIRREGEVVSRELILDSVWGTEAFPTPRTVDNYIMNLRKVFEDNPRQPNHILSVRSVGYKFRR